MRRALVIAGLLVAVLTGCGAASADSGHDDYYSQKLHLAHIDIPGRGAVQCVVYAEMNEGGLSCDWGHAQ